jgi:predicted nucleic acid-binding protein
MSANYFVYTNILVYTRDSTEPKKQPIAKQWLTYLWEKECGRISAQILNEYYVTITQKLNPGLSREQARSDIRALAVWQPLEISTTLIEASWDIQDQYSYSWWDSLVVTSALFLDCKYLLSEDMQHNQKIGHLSIINPFFVKWDELVY